MKITKYDVYQTGLPLKEGRYNWSNDNSIEVFDATVVAVATDDGIVGYGECTPLGLAYLPAYGKGVRSGLQEIGPKLIGMDPRDLGVINRRMDALLRGHPYVKSAIDVAVLGHSWSGRRGNLDLPAARRQSSRKACGSAQPHLAGRARNPLREEDRRLTNAKG